MHGTSWPAQMKHCAAEWACTENVPWFTVESSNVAVGVAAISNSPVPDQTS
jgi:hypothetical protein